MSTSWTPWNVIKAAAGNAEAKAHRTGQNENKPFDWIGVHASWNERRLFDWYYLAAEYSRQDNQEMAVYCRSRGDQFTT